MTLTKKEKEAIEIAKEKIEMGEAFRGKAGVAPKNLSEVFKKRICSQIIGFKQSQDLSDEALAEILEVTEVQALKIMAYHIDYFSLDFLVDKLEKLGKHSEEIQKEITRLLS